MQNAKGMIWISVALALALALTLAACTNRSLATEDKPPIVPPSAPLKIEANIAELSDRSCPDDARFTQPQSISINAAALANIDTEGAVINEGVTLKGIWALTSDEPNFGGLSGISQHRSGTLLSVSDAGAFVWIGLDDGAPDRHGAIAYMRDETGDVFDKKSAADAEGLALTDSGIALVSFERNARALAFDLEGCGGAARGALIAKVPDRPAGLGKTIPENEGPEALMIDPDGFLVGGLEAQAGDAAAIGKISPSAVSFEKRIARPSGTKLVGLDALDDDVFALFRGYLPLFGNTIVVHAYENGSTKPHEIATLKRPFPVDNFEGITAARLPDGTVRLYIISDDNFSTKQRTLLMAFDLQPTPDTASP